MQNDLCKWQIAWHTNIFLMSIYMKIIKQLNAKNMNAYMTMVWKLKR